MFYWFEYIALCRFKGKKMFFFENYSKQLVLQDVKL